MNDVGITYILEKKECTIEGRKRVYYEIIDCACGLMWSFRNTGEQFISLSKQLGFSINRKINTNSDNAVAGFKSFMDLTAENGNKFDIGIFMKEYRSHIGEYYTYDALKDTFSVISDENFINNIKSKKKDFDDAILDNDTDISQMYSEIKRTIISQDEQIMQILTTLFKNQKVVNSSLHKDIIGKLKENLIVYGSTGTGKTEIIKRISNIYKIPLVIEDATSFSETGYVGRDITSMLEDLYLAADKDMELAQKGILVIDEFDKLAEKNSSSHDHVSRIGVQRSLLKLLDGSTFYFGDQKFDTSKLSVVALGAFSQITNGDDYSKITTTDFVNYGIMRELMGRFSKRVAMNSLSKDDIKRILIESDFSPLNTYKLLFESMNISFSYDEDFVDYIAEKAVALNSGARSLKTVFDDTISSAMFRIFAGKYSAINLTKPTNDEGPYVLTKKR